MSLGGAFGELRLERPPANSATQGSSRGFRVWGLGFRDRGLGFRD